LTECFSNFLKGKKGYSIDENKNTLAQALANVPVYKLILFGAYAKQELIKERKQ